ncbi:MAG: hypothetical protein B6241_03060 [Spirochaetaceae bacterium 4572_59]|nr:MAG: hypothetical protein B6241_03060 [Spirochaetaceae bacterium 4572_59]
MIRQILLYSQFISFLLLFPESLIPEENLLDDLNKAQERGDFLEDEYISRVLSEKLTIEADPYIRTSLKRALWVHQVPLEKSGLFDFNISAMEADGDDIWIGTRSGDIARYSLSEQEWFILQKGAPSLAIRSVNAILCDKDRIWFLSYGSIILFDKRLGNSYFLDLPDHADYRGMQSLSLLGRGILVGTQSSGFRRILPGDETFIDIPGLNNISFQYKKDGDLLFAGTEETGLFVLDRFFHPHQVVSNNRRTASVRTLLPGDGYYVAGSYGNGLFQLISDGQVYEYRKIFSKGNWITDGELLKKGYCFSTLGNGLIYMSREDLVARSLGIPEGLPSLDIAALEYSSPYLICGTQGQGLLIIHENFFN